MSTFSFRHPASKHPQYIQGKTASAILTQKKWVPNNLQYVYVLLTVHLGIIFVNNQLDAKHFFMYVYFYSLHVSDSHVPIIRRFNCINTTSDIRHSVWMTSNFVQLCTSHVNRRSTSYDNHMYPVMLALSKGQKRNNISVFVNSGKELVIFLVTKDYRVRFWSSGLWCNK